MDDVFEQHFSVYLYVWWEIGIGYSLLASLLMSVDCGRLATPGNSRANNLTDSDLETWEAKHNESGGSAREHHQMTCARDLLLV